eukprot:Colp12_sorted_trinity150504_noHs@6865
MNKLITYTSLLELRQERISNRFYIPLQEEEKRAVASFPSSLFAYSIPWDSMQSFSERNRIQGLLHDATRLLPSQAGINVLVCGERGSGRSSLVDTLEASLRGEMPKPRSGVRAMRDSKQAAWNPSHHTQALPRLKIFDSTMSGHTFAALRDILIAGIRPSARSGIQQQPARIQDRIHTVIICLPALLAQERDVVEGVRKAARQANEMGVPTVLALTKLDQLMNTHTHTKPPLQKLASSDTTHRLIHSLSLATGIEPYRIVVTKGYSDESRVCPNVEMLALRSLAVALDAACDHVMSLCMETVAAMCEVPIDVGTGREE